MENNQLINRETLFCRDCIKDLLVRGIRLLILFQHHLRSWQHAVPEAFGVLAPRLVAVEMVRKQVPNTAKSSTCPADKLQMLLSGIPVSAFGAIPTYK